MTQLALYLCYTQQMCRIVYYCASMFVLTRSSWLQLWGAGVEILFRGATCWCAHDPHHLGLCFDLIFTGLCDIACTMYFIIRFLHYNGLLVEASVSIEGSK